MRIMASGDHHFDEHSGRFAECLRIHQWMVNQARELGVELFLSAGDLYERASTPIERQQVAQWVVAMAEVCEVVIVRGNHDAERDIELLSLLSSTHPIHVVETADVIRFGNVSVGAVAWPSRSSLAHIAEQAGISADTATIEAYEAVMRGFSKDFEEEGLGCYRIVLAHAMVDGSVTSVGQPLIGGEMHVPLSVLGASEADIVVLGHIHKPQEWTFGKTSIVYTGSPFRTAFGEVEEKSVLLIDTNAESYTRLPTPTSDMLLVDTEVVKRVDTNVFDVDGVGGAEGVPHVFHVFSPPIDVAVTPDCEIRLRYTVDADNAYEARLLAQRTKAELLAKGARVVKVEAVIRAVTRARAPEVTKATSIREKLEVLWKVRKVDLDESRKARLLSKLLELEA